MKAVTQVTSATSRARTVLFEVENTGGPSRPPVEWEVPKMPSSNPMQLFGTIGRIAEADRQFREIGAFVDRSLVTLRKFWPVAALLAAGWSFMAADEERLAVLEGLADQLMKIVSPEDIERWMAS